MREAKLRRLQSVRLKPKCILEAEEEARREAERKLDGTRFVWFCIGGAFAFVLTMLVLLFA